MSTKMAKGKYSADKERRDAVEYITIITQGKSVRAESDLLAKHSSVVKERLKEEEKSRQLTSHEEMSGTDICAEWLFAGMGNELKLEFPGLVYKDVKKAIAYLIKMNSDTEISKDGALQVLPVVQELGMNRLKKKCDSVILTDLQTRRVLALPEILEHLATAEKYDLPLAKTFCIEQCALHRKLVERDQIKSEKHITEKTKVEILGKMLDNVTTGYENDLKQIRTDMDSRCREIERCRDEFMEQTELWKNELGEKVMNTSKALGEAHTKLLEASYKTDLFKNLNGYIAFYNDQITEEFEHLRNKITDLADRILENKGLENPDELKATLEDELRKTEENTNLIKLGLEEKIASGIKTCAASRHLQNSLTENFELLEKLDQFSTTLDKKTKMLTVLEIKNATSEVKFEKLESELRDCLKRLHDINTWIKWAKPDRDGQGRCTCFRHSYSR